MKNIKITKIILLAISFSVATLFADMESDFVNNAHCPSAKGSEFENVKRYLERGGDPNVQNGKALIGACLNHNIDMVKLLLQYNADPKTDNSHALYFAAEGALRKWHDSSEMTKLLLEAGADASAKDSRALIRHADWGKNPKVIKMLVDAGANASAQDSQALIYAAWDADTECVKILLENGADAKAQDSKALIQAASFVCYNNIEMVKLLIEYGADPKAQDSQALIGAVEEHKTEIVKLLVKEGADPKAQGGKAILKAVENGYSDIVEFFIEIDVAPSDALKLALSKESTNRGLSKAIDCTNVIGSDAPVRNDFFYNRLESIKLFLREGADLDRALIRATWATQHSHEVVKLLLEAGADPTAENSLALMQAMMHMEQEQAASADMKLPQVFNQLKKVLNLLNEAVAAIYAEKAANIQLL